MVLIIAILFVLFFLLLGKCQSKHQAKLMTKEEIWKTFDRKYWEYKENRPTKIKEIAEAYIYYNGEICPMNVGDYGAWEFTYQNKFKALNQYKEYPYEAYKPTRFCIYKGYTYLFDVWGDIVILNPRSNKTRTYLKLDDTDRRLLAILYKDFIATSPTIWEERSKIKGFRFNVEHKVFLYKDNTYIEENLNNAWNHRR